jgi:hypothetical protein
MTEWLGNEEKRKCMVEEAVVVEAKLLSHHVRGKEEENH